MCLNPRLVAECRGSAVSVLMARRRRLVVVASVRRVPRQREEKEGVHTVHTLGFGFGCTGAGLGRIGDVSGEWRLFRGSARFESHTSGTVFSLFKGFLAFDCGHSVHLWAPSGAFFIAGRCVAGCLLAFLDRRFAVP